MQTAHFNINNIKEQLGVPLTYVYPNGIYCVCLGILGDEKTHKYPLYMAYSSGFPMTGYVGN